jgi:hypothetical protein
MNSREGFGADGLKGSRFGLFCCGWHDFVLGLHVFCVRLSFRSRFWRSKSEGETEFLVQAGKL